MTLQTICFVLNVCRFAMGYGYCCLDELNNLAMRAVFTYIFQGRVRIEIKLRKNV